MHIYFVVTEKLYLLFIAAVEAGVQFETWTAIAGFQLKNLMKDPRYPDNPDKTETLQTFDAPVDRGGDYGARFTAYYVVSVVNIQVYIIDTQMVQNI